MHQLHDTSMSFILHVRITQSSGKIRKALQHRICTFSCFDWACRVYHTHDNSNKWKGPGVVLGQYGKITLVHHGSIIVMSCCQSDSRTR